MASLNPFFFTRITINIRFLFSDFWIQQKAFNYCLNTPFAFWTDFVQILYIKCDFIQKVELMSDFYFFFHYQWQYPVYDPLRLSQAGDKQSSENTSDKTFQTTLAGLPPMRKIIGVINYSTPDIHHTRTKQRLIRGNGLSCCPPISWHPKKLHCYLVVSPSILQQMLDSDWLSQSKSARLTICPTLNFLRFISAVSNSILF